MPGPPAWAAGPDAAVLEVWARAVAMGISNRLFWELTPQEVTAVFAAAAERERRENLRAGLVAATMTNLWGRAPGGALVRAEDFFPDPAGPAEYMSPAEGQQALLAWAARQGGPRTPGRVA